MSPVTQIADSTTRLRNEVEQLKTAEGLRPLANRLGVRIGQIRGILDGRAALHTTLEALSDALGWEFYIGPPRDNNFLNKEPAYSGIAKILGLSSEASANEMLAAAASLAERAARVDEDAARWREIREALSAIQRELSEARDALRRAGISDEPNVYRLESEVSVLPTVDESSRPVAIMDYESAAGSGRYNLDNAPLRGRIWFTRAWLDKRGLYVDRCLVIGVAGESMEPTLPAGCSILVDRSRRRRRAGAIFVIETGDGLIVKRLDKSPGGAWRLISDNPSPDWPPLPWPDDARVAGQVMWMARSL